MKKMLYTVCLITCISLSNLLYGMQESDESIQIQENILHVEYAPLYHAACTGNIDTVKALLDKGAEVNQVNHNGATALHCASWHGYVEIVQLLCNAGANVHLTETNGNTPLQIAQLKKHVEVEQLLITAQACSSKTNKDKELTSLLERIRKL